MVIRGLRLGQPTLMDALAAGCIPVVIADSYVLPYAEVIDWKRVSIQIYEDDLDQLMGILQAVSSERIEEMRSSGSIVFNRYFSSIEKIANTVLRILNGKVKILF